MFDNNENNNSISGENENKNNEINESSINNSEVNQNEEPLFSKEYSSESEPKYYDHSSQGENQINNNDGQSTYYQQDNVNSNTNNQSEEPLFSKEYNNEGDSKYYDQKSEGQNQFNNGGQWTYYQQGNMNNNTNYNNEPHKKKGGKSAKIIAAVAGCVLIAFSGGLVGGYVANKNSNTNATGQKTISSSDYAAPEFLSSTDGSLTVSEAIEKVKPAVVTISTKTTSQDSWGFSQDVEGLGSGVIINGEGYVITNYHVIEGSTDVSVILSNENEVSATVVNYDQQKDLAMLKLEDGTEIPGVAELGDSDALYPGQDVIAIGTPLSKEFAYTCTKGIISAVGRSVETSTGITMNLIQTDTAINPGNSGGPLINTKGQVIGINSMKLVTTEVEGIGFSIPINEVSDRLENLSKPIITLGITIQNVTDELSKKYDLPIGVYVKSVNEFSVAEKGGIKSGDVIVEFDGKKITTSDELNEAKNAREKGDTVKVVVYRNDKEITLELTL